MAHTISLPGGASSELDIVMKLHKVERHIRNNKLKVLRLPYHCALLSADVMDRPAMPGKAGCVILVQCTVAGAHG